MNADKITLCGRVFDLKGEVLVRGDDVSFTLSLDEATIAKYAEIQNKLIPHTASEQRWHAVEHPHFGERVVAFTRQAVPIRDDGCFVVELVGILGENQLTKIPVEDSKTIESFIKDVAKQLQASESDVVRRLTSLTGISAEAIKDSLKKIRENPQN